MTSEGIVDLGVQHDVQLRPVMPMRDHTMCNTLNFLAVFMILSTPLTLVGQMPRATRAPSRVDDGRDVGNLGNAYVYKAMIVDACKPRLTAGQVRDEMKTLITPYGEARLNAALRTFDLTIQAQRAGSPFPCDSADYNRELAKATTEIDAARTTFLDLMKQKSVVPQQSSTQSAAGAAERSASAAAALQPSSSASGIASDPRVRALPANIRALVETEAATYQPSCEQSVSLSNVYTCTCYAQKMLDSLLAQGPKTGVAMGGRVTLSGQMDAYLTAGLTPCINQTTLTAYTDRTVNGLLRDARYAPRLPAIRQCTASRVVAFYRIRPQTLPLNDAIGENMLNCMNQ